VGFTGTSLPQTVSGSKIMHWVYLGFYPKNRPIPKAIDTYFATAYINVSMQWATARLTIDDFATSL
jgi:hypothetical protein